MKINLLYEICYDMIVFNVLNVAASCMLFYLSPIIICMGISQCNFRYTLHMHKKLNTFIKMLTLNRKWKN